MSHLKTETAKYERAWSDAVYRRACHGLNLWHTRRSLFPAQVSSAVDLGCGLGLLMERWCVDGIDGWGVDLIESCLHPSVREKWGHRLMIETLWDMDLGRRFDLGVCADVMEHLPPQHVGDALRCISECCDEVLFKVAHSPSVFNGDVLHLTLEPSQWWVDQMLAHMKGSVDYLGIEVRSGCNDSLIRWRR